MKKSIFEINKNENGFFFVLKNEGETIGESKYYETKQNCQIGIASVKESVLKKNFVSGSYDAWFFMLKSKNGRSVLFSPYYATEKEMVDAMVLVIDTAVDAEIVDLTKRAKR